MSITKTTTVEVLPPRKYAIAVCSSGFVGLILSDAPEPVVYDDHTEGVAWTGIHITHSTHPVGFGDTTHNKTVRPGDPWSSRAPRVVGYLQDMDIAFRPHVDEVADTTEDNIGVSTVC